MSLDVSIICYCLMYAWALSFYFFAYNFREKNRGLYCIVFAMAVAPIVFLYAFRYGVGTDWANYTYLFNYSREHSWNLFEYPGYLNYEIGFLAIVKLLTTVLPNAGVWAAFALVQISLFESFISRHEQDAGFSPLIAFSLFYVLFLLGGLNILRQTIAVLIVLNAVEYCTKRKSVFVCYVLLASTIHASALVALCMLPFWNTRLDRPATKAARNVILLIIGLLVAGGYGPLLALISRIPGLGIFSKYAYVTAENAGLNRTLIVVLLVTAIIAVLSERYASLSSTNDFYISLAYLVLIFSLAGFFNKYAYRIADYFRVSYLVLFPRLPALFNSKERAAVSLVTISLSGIYMFLLYIYARSGGILPISFIWD